MKESGVSNTTYSHAAAALKFFIAKSLLEDSSGIARLMESICEWENMLRALKRVEANDGAPGIDGMTCRQLRRFVTRMWQASKQALLAGGIGSARQRLIRRV